MTPEQLGISQWQYNNLSKLADVLDTVDDSGFDMVHFSVDSNGCKRGVSAPDPECATVACAAGHLPLVVEPHTSESTEDEWEGYVNRVTGVDVVSDIAGDLDGWDWLFITNWCRVDNTAKGAAQRIRYMLNKGIPNDASCQIMGLKPLCYR